MPKQKSPPLPSEALAHEIGIRILLLVEFARARKKNADKFMLAHVEELCASQGKSFRDGRKPEIARLMTELSGRNVTRDMVRAWLHPDPKKRRQPSLRYGLLLIAAGMLADPEKPQPKRRITND